jgi:hypothetical protein
LCLCALSLFFSAWGYAFPCYFTLVKDQCWKDYKISVDVLDTSKNSKILTAVVPEGSQWTRTAFECSAKQSLDFIASFSPAFWENEVGKTYHAKRSWMLPLAATDEVAWNITICYPGDFSAVPMPPEANNHCGCDTSNIPPVEDTGAVKR